MASEVCALQRPIENLPLILECKLLLREYGKTLEYLHILKLISEKSIVTIIEAKGMAIMSRLIGIWLL